MAQHVRVCVNVNGMTSGNWGGNGDAWKAEIDHNRFHLSHTHINREREKFFPYLHIL